MDRLFSWLLFITEGALRCSVPTGADYRDYGHTGWQCHLLGKQRLGEEEAAGQLLPSMSPQKHLCHNSASLSHGVSCPPVQSSTQEIGEELEDGVIYSISLRKVQLHHMANKGQRWLGVSWAVFRCFPGVRAWQGRY